MIKVTFYGTRGSIPTPSSKNFSTVEYGGNTTCVLVENEHDDILILDAGTGIRLLGNELVKKTPFDAALFFSHQHWDHIQGFPFFTPVFIPVNTFKLYGPMKYANSSKIGCALESTLRGQQEYPQFPVHLDQLPSHLSFQDIPAGKTVEYKNFTVTTFLLNHPDGSFAYKIKQKNNTIVFCTDIEHRAVPSLTSFIKDADLLIYDGQYTEDEYCGKSGMPRLGWGHSTFEWGIKEQFAAGVKHLIITHHDPAHDDAFLKKMEQDASLFFDEMKTKNPDAPCQSVSFAREGGDCIIE